MPSAQKLVFKISRLGLFPLIFYLFFFIILTYPLILKFSSHFFTDVRDGFQNIWNIWWVNKAITQLHQLPWHTTYQYFPEGTSLLPHTLNPLNGFLGIFLLQFLSMTETFNFILIFSFIAGGLTAFLLAYYISHSYWGSIFAGFIFTFCNYHFAHAEGHLQLVSLEWIPLFILCWFVFLNKPSITLGIGSALTLLAVILCDYYYFFYSVMAAILIVIWYIVKKKTALFLFRREYYKPLLAFLTGLLLFTGPLVISILAFCLRNPLYGMHNPREYSLDLFALLIPGGHWRFAQLTKNFWSQLPGNINESSVHMGISVVIVLILTWILKKKIRSDSLSLWYVLLGFFMIFSLGPVLQIWGKQVNWFKLPYPLLELICPPLKLSGVPVRMMVMVMLFAGIIFSVGYHHFFSGKTLRFWFPALLLIILFLEYLPKKLPETRVNVPKYIKILKNLPDDKGVIDDVSDQFTSLYFQTIHEKPISKGYISRLPVIVSKREERIVELFRMREFELLFRRYRFRYILTKKRFLRSRNRTPVKILYDDGEIRLYDIVPINWR